MAKDSGGSFRLELGEPLGGKLTDFCEAHYEGSKTAVIRRAVELLIDSELSTETQLRERYERLREKRINGGDVD